MIVSLEAPTQSDDHSCRLRRRILSCLSLQELVEAEGATWLDKELLSRRPESLADEGFGARTCGALARTCQWLASRSLGILTRDGAFQPTPDLLNRLRQRELQQAALALSQQLRPDYSARDGEHVADVYLRPIHLASGKHAVIQRSKEFTLMPWRQGLKIPAKRTIGVAVGA
jgi:hypothetical protein